MVRTLDDVHFCDLASRRKQSRGIHF
jgi:hypothetical protein